MSKRIISGNVAAELPAAAGRDAYGMTQADYARLDAKTDEDIARDCASDPDATPWSADRVQRMRRIARVKFIREQLRMSQPEFAKVFRIPLGTLRDWEQHRAEPDQAARAYLAVIAAAPDTVRKALAQTPP